jgi:iron complex transport system substrate-binding protein
MNNNKLIAILATVIVVMSGFGVVYMLTQNDSSDGDIVIDARGRKVAIPDEIDSILGIKSCSLQLVSFFDAVNNVTHLDVNESFVGTDNRTHTFVLNDLLMDLPRIDPNDAEKVIASGVDIVISSTVSVSELDDEQRKYGVPVFGVNADAEFDSKAFYDQITALGKLFGEEKRANELIDGIKSFVKDITDFACNEREDLTAYACGMTYYRATNDPFLRTTGNYLPFTYSNITNVSAVANNGQPYSVSLEKVIDSNPQMIFVDGLGLKDVVTYIKANMKTVGMIDAVSNGEIYKTMVYKSWGTNWLNQLINIYYAAKIIHPGDFGWDFEYKANEIIQLFYPGTEVTYSDIANAQAGGGCGKVTL